MRAGRAAAALVVVASLFGCGEEARSTWTRVEVYAGATRPFLYSVAHYDPDADVCVMIQLGDTLGDNGVLGNEMDEIELDLRGDQGYLLTHAYAYESGYYDAAERCQPESYYTSRLVKATGKIRLSDFSNAEQPGTPCKFSIDLEVRDPSDQGQPTRQVSVKSHPIAAAGCPQPMEYVAEVGELDAAYGDYEGLDNLVIAAWDDAREVCALARFIRDGEGLLEPAQVDSPGDWVYTGVRFTRLAREACVAADFIEPPTDFSETEAIYTALRSSGSLRFATREGELPCSLDVELELHSRGEYYWTPDVLRLDANAVEVAGGCT